MGRPRECWQYIPVSTTILNQPPEEFLVRQMGRKRVHDGLSGTATNSWHIIKEDYGVRNPTLSDKLLRTYSQYRAESRARFSERTVELTLPGAPWQMVHPCVGS